ncbi:procathepsin L-like [Dreissena polymorpha]|uniref:Cathepsin L n=1 Tax=Dreissena polymorpha TaxID=45954 RepID=A0A9D4D673_DREPO|nr:procathepsin L-like [Dreissena polymorpha]KAH3738694.1 hypothetical protein DPMN_045334 [Dreissena polymorpha]
MVLQVVTHSLLVMVVFSTVASYDGVIQIGVYNMSLPTDELFQLFKETHERKYKHVTEENKRRQIFADNVRYIHKHNAQYASGESTYYLGINQFTDMTYKEFAVKFANLRDEHILTGNASIFFHPENYKAPSSVDWRQKGYVTLVKNQGECGSCWSFSVTGTIEGQNFRKTGQLVSLSEQQLIDCSRNYGNQGCDGGYLKETLQYVTDAGGIEGEADYSYKGKDVYPCSFSAGKVRATIRGYSSVPDGEKNLETSTATVGPIAVAIEINQNFISYTGGVFYDADC